MEVIDTPAQPTGWMADEERRRKLSNDLQDGMLYTRH
jgi:hypothetical protein